MTAPTAHGRRFLSAKDCALLSPIRAGVVIKWAKTRGTFYVPLCKKWPQMCATLPPFKRRLFTYFVGDFCGVFKQIRTPNARKTFTNRLAFFHVLGGSSTFLNLPARSGAQGFQRFWNSCPFSVNVSFCPLLTENGQELLFSSSLCARRIKSKIVKNLRWKDFFRSI